MYATRMIPRPGGGLASNVINDSTVTGSFVDDALDWLKNNRQPLDATLTALAALDASAGVLCQTGADAFSKRTITGTSGRITVADGTGGSANPTIDLATVLTPAGPTGAAGTIPVVTVDAYGRVTALTSIATTGEALTLSDLTTNNVSTSKHGFFPKLNNTATNFFDMTGVQRALATADLGTTMTPQFAYIGLNVAVDSSFVLKGDNASANCLASLTTGGASSQAGFNFGYTGQVWRFAANAAFGRLTWTDVTAAVGRMFMDTSGNLCVANSGTALGRMESRATSIAQVAASYDGSNYLTLTVSSAGLATWTGAGTSKGHVFTDGVQCGSGTGRGKIVSVLKTIATTAANSGSGATDLHSFTMPANTLAADGDSIEIEMTFSCAANANVKNLTVSFGATTVWSDSGAINGGFAVIRAIVTRTGATTQRYSFVPGLDPAQPWATGLVGGGGVPAAETLSGSVTIKAVGQGTSTNDIVQRSTIIKFLPANA